MTEKIRVLHILPPGDWTFGGIEAFLYNYYKNMNREAISFDFSFCGTNTMVMRCDEAIFKDSVFNEYKSLKTKDNSLKNWVSLFRKIRRQVYLSKYDIVEIHSSSPFLLVLCGLALSRTHIKVKIAHSHVTSIESDNPILRIIILICKKIISRLYLYFFACSYSAANAFDKLIVSSDRFLKINNAIKISDFEFNNTTRDRVRKENGVFSNNIIIGHVARLSKEKNQLFLIDVFYELHKRHPEALLWIIGEGGERANIEDKINRYGLKDHIFLLGERNDINNLLQAMDMFIITSEREGLCIAAIEAQAAGLPTFVSTGIPDECRVSNAFFRISLEKSCREWAKYIDKNYNFLDRNSYNSQIKEHGYSIEESANQLQKKYEAMVKSRGL